MSTTITTTTNHPQPHPHLPTQKYTSLRNTALSFINTLRFHASLPSKLDIPTLHSLTAPSFTHTFGPTYSVSRAPKLQGLFTVDELVAHLGNMVPLLERWEVVVNGCVVDEAAECVVVRVGYGMWVRGATEVVVNDIVWWLELEECVAGGENRAGWKVRRSTEMVDAGAAGRIRELMAESKELEVCKSGGS